MASTATWGAGVTVPSNLTGTQVSGGATAVAGLSAYADLVVSGGQLVTPGIGAPNTVYLAGDSLMANGYVVTSTNFVNRASEGWFNWLDWYLGAPFSVVGSVAAGGKTTSDFLSSQLATVIASGARYCALSIGINDINVSLLSGAVTAANVITCVQSLMAYGITPIWSTLFPQTYDSVVTPKVAIANDLLRQFAAANKCGIFVDLYPSRVDPTAAYTSPNPSRGASYSYDSPTYLHPNNLGALMTGMFGGSKISGQVPYRNFHQVSNEDVALVAGNLLKNPGFSGTGGTVSANCTGTMPDGWVIDWATRTGTGSAAAAVVSVTDTVTGLVIAQAIQVTISGSAASGDVVRVYQSDSQNATLKSSFSTGNVMNAEGIVTLATAANVSQVAMRVQTNTNESTWAGSNGQTAGTFPATMPAMSMRTGNITVLGSGVASQARYDLRVSFSGAGTGTVITLSRPRVRKVS